MDPTHICRRPSQLTTVAGAFAAIAIIAAGSYKFRLIAMTPEVRQALLTHPSSAVQERALRLLRRPPFNE